MSKIEVDAIEPQSGTTLTIGASGDTITIPSGATLTNSGTATGFGKVLQVVSTTKTDATSTTSGSFVDITGMSVSITPSSISNKILILYDIGVSSTEADRSDQIRLLRDATTIVSSANIFRITANSYMYNASLNYLDSPSSTSALTYKLQWLSEAGVGTVYLNRRGNSATPLTASTITAMEIAG
jgi:hypothetical protein